MVELLPSLDFWGEQFSPKKAEAVTGLALSRKNEPGDIGDTGRYRGQPIPYGAASLETPETIGVSRRLTWLLECVAPHVETLRRLGAELVRLHVEVRYQGQCNLEFSPGEVAGIAALRVAFTISCWDCTEEGGSSAEPGAAADRPRD